MFSSTYHDSISNPFSNFPSSSYPTLPFLIDPENDHFVPNNNNNNNTTLLDDPLSVVPPPFNIPTTHDAPILFPTEEETVSNLALVADHCTAMFEQDASYCAAAANYGSNIINSNNISFPNFLNQKQPAIAKKDRHSKIHTSQGLRDRRVRLSSEIARKFFDLQDMLEFDKPSNTLEWLFTKSDNAIKELARSKQQQHHSGGEIEKEEVDQDYSNNYNNKSLTGGGGGDGCSSKGRKQLKWTQREETKKESRERARARARERTCYKRVQELEERCPVTTANTHQMLNQLMSSSSSSSPAIQPPYYNPPHHLLDSETLRDLHGFNVIEESIMIKRNMMSSHQHQHHQQNLAIPNKEPSFNNNVVDYPLFPYSTTPNWEANGFSNFYGIATMNLSTCFMNQW